MTRALERFVEELALHPGDPFLYDELTLRYILQDVSDVIAGSEESYEEVEAYIAAVESSLHILSSKLDGVSFGFGSAWAASVLLSGCLDRSRNRVEESRRFRCFQKYMSILKQIEEHPLYSHTELADAIGKTKGRLSQIIVELKANQLVLVDKLGRENRYELTSYARRLLGDELSRDCYKESNVNISQDFSIGDIAEQWTNKQDGIDRRSGMLNSNATLRHIKNDCGSRLLSNVA